MLAGSHFLIGSSLAVLFSKNYFIAFLLGFVSHHLIDKLPHLDLNIFKKDNVLFKDKNLKAWLLVIFEFFSFLILTFYLLEKFSLEVQKIAFWGGIGGIFPDVFILVFKRFAFTRKIFSFYFNFHKNFHFKLKDKNFILPFLVQSTFVILSFLILANYKGY